MHCDLHTHVLYAHTLRTFFSTFNYTTDKRHEILNGARHIFNFSRASKIKNKSYTHTQSSVLNLVFTFKYSFLIKIHHTLFVLKYQKLFMYNVKTPAILKTHPMITRIVIFSFLQIRTTKTEYTGPKLANVIQIGSST